MNFANFANAASSGCGASAYSVIAVLLACAARGPATTPAETTRSVTGLGPDDAASVPASDAADRSAAQHSPRPPSVLADPGATQNHEPPPAAEPATTLVPAQVQFASLAPFHAAKLRDGWLVVHIPAVDEAALARVQEATGFGDTWLWAGHRSIPAEVRELGSIHVVSQSGVKRLDAYARIAADPNGWLIAYRRTAAKSPVLALRGAPAGQARVRLAPKPKAIKRSHPMAARMRELIAKADLPADEVRRLGRYELQIVPGSFPGANRIVTVAAYAVGVDGEDVGDYEGVVFTIDEGDFVQQVVRPIGDPTVVDGVLDLDGDGLDEVLTTSSGYESGSGDLHRLTQGTVESFNLWSHDE